MNGRLQMQGGKNWILPKWINANRFFLDAHWLEIWSNHYGTEWRDRGYGHCTQTLLIVENVHKWNITQLQQ
jgi:hypothetical protein